MILNTLRNISFWIIDSLKKDRIKTHLKEVKFCIDNPCNNTTKQIKKEHLEKILNHATKTTPFYDSFGNTKDVLDFPVISKTVIQDNFENFQSSDFKDKDNFKVSTSGSTGIPFFLFQNQKKRHRNHADVIYFFKKTGFKIGNRLYELEVWKDHNQKSKFKAWLQNTLQFDITRLTDKRIEAFLELLKSDQQSDKALLGFASAFEMISQYLEKKNLFFKDLDIISVIASSEYLTPYTKITLAKHLNTTVLSRYSSEEVGIIAHQTLDSPNSFVINHASYHVEILNLENDEPVKLGEFGRIVVTDFFNYAMPLIRYDTGDIAKYGVDKNGIMELEQIEGRKMDLIYDSKGNIISSFVVYTKFYKYYTLLKQYQFIQQGEKSYEVKLNLQEDTFRFENELVADIKSDFGSDANVVITYVNEIPALASGKRRKVISNYKKK